MVDFYQWREQRNTSSLLSTITTTPVAYFCMEFALPDNLPIYAGGLGVLAGDYIMEAHEQNFPMVAIGLFYSEKCYPGDNEGFCSLLDAHKLGLTPVNDVLGQRIKVNVPVGQKNVIIQAWRYDRGTVPLYLLDTNLKENETLEREITKTLYSASPELRLKQELILGIGGARLLPKLGINPSIYHMNEGHSAFLVFELMNQQGRGNENFEALFDSVKKKIAFTNHTLVVGGHDVFDNEMVSENLSGYVAETGFEMKNIIEKGRDKSNPKVFSATFLALNSAGVINGVSVLHAKEAAKLWPEYQTLAVTNGINLRRWDKIKDDSDLQAEHAQNKKKLLRYIKNETGVKWRESELLIGWARRIVSYKRPTALFEDIDHLKKICLKRKEPLHIVFSGQPHYHDTQGKMLLNHLRQVAKGDLRRHMVFLENYSTGLSNLLTSGCDVWLNTPIVGLEACGTSGMKAALNGVLNCSTNDGWLPEVDLDKIGFILDDKYISLSLLDILENRIIPLYYGYRANKKVSPIWGEKMLSSRQIILQKFGADRMLKDYIEMVYKKLLEKQNN